MTRSPSFARGRAGRSLAHRGVLVGLLISAGACGSSEGAVQVTFPLRMPISLAECGAAPEDFAELLGAELRIGGHDPCPLTVDAAAGTASGSCEEITVGIVRPLALVWSLSDPGGGNPMPLAYHVTYVDLRKEALEGGSEDNAVSISFPDDGVDGAAWWHPTHLADLPEPTANSSDCQGVECLEMAQSWAHELALGAQPANAALDHDQDGCPNLSEACQGGATLVYSSPAVLNDDHETTGESCHTRCEGETCTCCAYPNP